MMRTSSVPRGRRGGLRVALLLGLLAALTPSLAARTWTDRQGQSVQGKFVRVHEGNVVLLARGRALSVPFAQLSDEDQAYVREQLREQGQEVPLPPTLAPPPAAETAAGGAADPRSWTDLQGRRIWARLVRRQSDSVVLEMNGQEFTVPLATLSAADQQFVLQATAKVAAGDAQERMAGQAGGHPGGSPLAPSLPFTPPDLAPPATSPPSFPQPTPPSVAPASPQTLGNAATAPWLDDYRTWQLPGSGDVHATLDRLKAGGIVSLLREDGQKTYIAFRDLSTADQQYVRQQVTALGKAYTLPPPAAVTAPAPVEVAQAPVEGVSGIPNSASSGPPRSAPPPTPSRPPAVNPPSSRPPSAPPTPEFPGIPQRGDEIDGYCSNCDAPIPASIGAGDKCPQCGVFFEYEEDAFGRERHYSEQANRGNPTVQANIREFEQEQSSSNRFRLRGRSIRGILWVAMALVGGLISLGGWIARKVAGSD